MTSVPEDEYYLIDGAEVRRLRTAKNRHQGGLGVHRNTIVKIEAAGLRGYRASRAATEAIAGELDVPISTILVTSSGTARGLADARDEYFRAMREPSPLKARRAFDNAHRLAMRHKDAQGARRLASLAIARLAELSDADGERRQLRVRAVEILDGGTTTTQRSTEDLIAFANRVVDCHDELVSRASMKWVTSMVAAAKSHLKRRLAGQRHGVGVRDETERAAVLVQISSLLRCQARSSRGRFRRSRIQEMLRCARLAVGISDQEAGASIELAQALVYAAGGRGQREYREMVREAQDLLRDAADTGWPVAALVLARVYRMTYEDALSVQAFREYAEREREMRRALRNASICGEAAWKMHKSGISGSREALRYARGLLYEAVETGYSDARTVLALGYVEASLGEYGAGRDVLLSLGRRRHAGFEGMVSAGVSYVERGRFEDLTRAFVFGCDDGATWNRLGTFAREFLDDPRLATSLYEVGRRLDPKSHVLSLNLARMHADAGNIEEARGLLRRVLRGAPQGLKQYARDVWRSLGKPRPS